MKISPPRKNQGKPKGGWRPKMRLHIRDRANNFRYGIVPKPYQPMPYAPVRTWADMTPAEQDEIRRRLGVKL